jgi:drug/metabolite transporter (DMT)-like permease
LVNAVAVTAFGFVIYFRLIRTIGSMGTASVSYLKPAVGILVGCMFMGEQLTWALTAGLMVILLGVAAINQRGSSGASLWFAPKLAMRAVETN